MVEKRKMDKILRLASRINSSSYFAKSVVLAETLPHSPHHRRRCEQQSSRLSASSSSFGSSLLRRWQHLVANRVTKRPSQRILACNRGESRLYNCCTNNCCECIITATSASIARENVTIFVQDERNFFSWWRIRSSYSQRCFSIKFRTCN